MNMLVSVVGGDVDSAGPSAPSVPSLLEAAIRRVSSPATDLNLL